MAKEDINELLEFLHSFPEFTQEIALWLREFVWDLYPDCNELIYDGYNALAFGWGLSDRLGDVFCSIAVYKNVNFGFNRGSEINDPQKKLIGNGNLYRYMKVFSITDFPKQYAADLLHSAYVNALSRGKQKAFPIKGKTIVKSISDKKRRPL